jgi:2-amino-4-hydroxy-6-hydroxymethyldihydropteridine diphosphokinase
MHEVYLSLGSNLGDREAHLRHAICLLEERVGRVRRLSTFLETAPWGFSSPHSFLNAAVCVETELSPRKLLEVTQEMEREMGRRKTGTSRAVRKHMDGQRQEKREYHDRPIDIDILLYDDLTVREPDLQIPHPLMHERDFVMIPLREIRPET